MLNYEAFQSGKKNYVPKFICIDIFCPKFAGPIDKILDSA